MKQVFFASTLHFGSDTLFPLDYTVIITTVTFLLKSKGNVCIPGDAAGFDSLFEKRSSMMTVKSRWHSCKKKVLSTKTFSLPKNLQNTMRVQGVFKLLFSEFTQFCLKVCLKSRWSKKGLWSETEAFQAHVKWGLCHAWNASILSKTRDFFTKSFRFEKTWEKTFSMDFAFEAVFTVESMMIIMDAKKVTLLDPLDVTLHSRLVLCVKKEYQEVFWSLLFTSEDLVHRDRVVLSSVDDLSWYSWCHLSVFNIWRGFADLHDDFVEKA